MIEHSDEKSEKEIALVRMAREAIITKKDSINYIEPVEYLLSGCSVEKYWANAAKIDVDVKLVDVCMSLWKRTRIAILRELTFIPIDVLIDRDVKTDDRRGFHAVVTYLSSVELNDETLNFVELLLGSDTTRYEINKRRIEHGIHIEDASILFSKILKRFPQEECDKCGLKRALEEIVGDM